MLLLLSLSIIQQHKNKPPETARGSACSSIVADANYWECQEKSIKEEKYKVTPLRILLQTTTTCVLALPKPEAFNCRAIYFFPESLHI